MFKKLQPYLKEILRGLPAALAYGFLWMWVFIFFVQIYNPLIDKLEWSIYIMAYVLSVLGVYLTRGIANRIKLWVEEDLKIQGRST